MINIHYDLIEERFPSTAEKDGRVNCKANHKKNLKHNVESMPARSLVAFHTQLGTIQGYFERLSRIYFTGNITVKVHNGLSSMNGDVTVYWNGDGVLVNEIMQEIDGLSYALAHGYLGDYNVTLTFSQTCEIKVVA